jgi:hypothetical protein
MLVFYFYYFYFLQKLAESFPAFWGDWLFNLVYSILLFYNNNVAVPHHFDACPAPNPLPFLL